jgi:hypothetical protein
MTTLIINLPLPKFILGYGNPNLRGSDLIKSAAENYLHQYSESSTIIEHRDNEPIPYEGLKVNLTSLGINI